MSPYLGNNHRYQRKPRIQSLREAGKFLGFSVLAIFIVLFIFGFVAYALQVEAATGINKQLNYQGKLNDSSGVAVADATYNIKLAIYAADSGGSCLWTAVGSCADSNIATTTVTTVNGVFSVALGGTGHNSLATSSIDFNDDSLYLGVTVRGTAATPVYDSEMTPRKRITSAVYAFNADTVDGIHAVSGATTADALLALDSQGNFDLLGQGVSSTRATTTWLYVGSNATVTSNLNIGGYASTTNLVLGNDGTNLGTYNDLYVSGGNLFFNATQLGGGTNDWQIIWPGTLAPTSTGDTYGAFFNASTTVAANFRVDGNATTTGGLSVDGTTLIVQADTNRVGIGTASPDEDLEVEGNIHLDDNYKIYLGTGKDAELYTTNGDHLTIKNVTSNSDIIFNVNNDGTPVDILTLDAAIATMIVTADSYLMGDVYVGTGDGNIAPWGNSDDLIFHTGIITGTSEKMRIVNGGSVGIGTTTPWGLLSVHSKSADTRPLFVVASTTPDGILATSTKFIVSSIGNVGIGTASPTSTLQVSGGDVHFQGLADVRGMYWDTSATSLGIGTLSPSEKLDVVGNIEIDNGSLIFDPDAGGVRYIIGPASQDLIIQLEANNNQEGLVISDTDDTEMFRFDVMNGRLGIGTVAPDYALSVVGTASSTNLLVGNKATSTVALWVGSGGIANNLSMSGGDLYVQDDLEVDGTAYLANVAIAGDITSYFSAACGAGEYLNDIADDGTFACTDASTEIDSIVATHTAISDAHHTATVNLTENQIEAYIFDSDAQNISGVWEVQDDINFVFGNDANWKIQYDEGVDNQLIFITTQTTATADSDPLFEILSGSSMDANQQIFGVAKGIQASNTALLTLDAEGDLIVTGDLAINGGDITSDVDLTINPTGGDIIIANSAIDFELEDGSMCIGEGGCATSTGDGNLLVEGEINVGRTGVLAYNAFGTGAEDGSIISNANDLYITDSLEIDGGLLVAGRVAFGTDTLPTDNVYLNIQAASQSGYGVTFNSTNTTDDGWASFGFQAGTGANEANGGFGVSGGSRTKDPGSVWFTNNTAGGDFFINLDTTDEVFRISSGGEIFMEDLDTSGENRALCMVSSTGEIIMDLAQTCASSAKRYKHDIRPLTYGLEEILQLKPSFFRLNSDPQVQHMGLIADDVLEVIPELVHFDENGVIDTLHFYDIFGLLVKGIQEQQIQIDELKVGSIPTSIEPVIEVIDNPNLDIDTLVVQQAATFYGTLYVQGEAGFAHKVVFEEDIEIKGKVYVSADQAGTAVIKANATSTEIVFDSDYEIVPRITATAQLPIPLGIIEQTENGFRVFIAEPQEQNIAFDWIALGVKDLALNNEDEEPEPIDETIEVDLPSPTATLITDFFISDDQIVQGDLLELQVNLIEGVKNSTIVWLANVETGVFSGNGTLAHWGGSSLGNTTEVTFYVIIEHDGVTDIASQTVNVIVPDTEPEPVIVMGCTDNTALNFNLDANQDDGSCSYPEPIVLGCMDEGALNYNSDATEDDGSCGYEEIVVELTPTSTEEVVVKEDSLEISTL